MGVRVWVLSDLYFRNKQTQKNQRTPFGSQNWPLCWKALSYLLSSALFLGNIATLSISVPFMSNMQISKYKLRLFEQFYITYGNYIVPLCFLR